MNRLLCLAACLASLAAAPPAHVADPEPAAPLPDAATIAAVRKLGENYDVMVRDQWGHPETEDDRSRRGRSGLPYFHFGCTQADNTLIALPPIRVPFGLDLLHTPVTEAGLKHLATRTTLRRLVLGDVGGPKLTDAALARLAELKGLESLDLHDVGLTDKRMKHVARLTRLRHLSVFEQRPELSDAGLAHLAALKRLETLSLSGDMVSNAGLAHLAGFANLRHLSLSGCTVTDAGLKHLSRLDRLRSLELSETRVTDEGLKHLADLNELRLLFIGRSARVTAEGVARLRKALPALKVKR